MPTSPAAPAPPPPPVERRAEGGTTLLLPALAPHRGPAARTAVFYNPAMALDRDLNVAFAEVAVRRGRSGLDGWEMLGATGVRGMRLAHESKFLRSLRITELAPAALAVLEENARSVAPDRVRVEARDARIGDPGAAFDYLDLDPYGSPLPFLPTLFAAARDDALVAVSATDMMVLAGVTRGACERLYGSQPIRGRLAPEAGLRILLARLAREARSRGRAIHPLLSYVHDHHVRTYFEVRRSDSVPADPVETIDPVAWTGPQLRGAGPFGPLWTGPLGDTLWVRDLRPPAVPARGEETVRFIERLVEESAVDRPFFYEPNELARQLGSAEPPSIASLLEGIRATGALAVRAHPREAAIRTTAPRAIVEAVGRRLTTGP